MPDGQVFVVIEMGEVRDPSALAAYQQAARAQLAKRPGAIVVARGGETFEGDPPFGKVMIQQWPSEAAFREWQESEAYAPFRAMRLDAVSMRIAIVPAV